MPVTPIVLALTASGEATARRAAEALGAPLHGRRGRVSRASTWFDDSSAHVRALFAGGVPVVGVCSSDLLIRAVAPLLGDESEEPPVLSISADGSSVVPLLGGRRGAPRLAAEIAAALGGRASVTAGDLTLGVALDAPPAGWGIANPELVQDTTARLLGGMRARIAGDDAWRADWLSPLPATYRGSGSDEVLIEVTERPAQEDVLTYHPRRHVLGIACARNCSPEELLALVEGALGESAIAPQALAGICTLDLGADAPAVLELARRFDRPLRLFSAGRLEEEYLRLATPSETDFAEFGCHGVAEGAALVGAGQQAVLKRPRETSAHASCALAEAPDLVAELGGRPRGRLSLVCIGSGQSDRRTPEASKLIAEAEELVGQRLGPERLGGLSAAKPQARFPPGAEEACCRYALERAGQGHHVALICPSGAGIAATGGLVFDLLARDPRAGGVSPAARRSELAVAPGISALQAIAARAGSPLGPDFCAISLSDPLHARGDIERRIRAAAEGDFVIAFQEPGSPESRGLLAEAQDLLLRHRPAATPVLLAVNLEGAGESLIYRRLDDVSFGEVDALIAVIVGSSRTRLLQLGEGARMFTPGG